MLSIESKFFSLGLTIGVTDEKRKGKLDVYTRAKIFVSWS